MYRCGCALCHSDCVSPLVIYILNVFCMYAYTERRRQMKMRRICLKISIFIIKYINKQTLFKQLQAAAAMTVTVMTATVCQRWQSAKRVTHTYTRTHSNTHTQWILCWEYTYIFASLRSSVHYFLDTCYILYSVCECIRSDLNHYYYY